MLLEIMGLQLPGSSFVNPGIPLRSSLTAESVRQLKQMKVENRAVGKIVCEKTIVNAIVGLLATGGSTNHTIHLITIAAAAGIIVYWQDFSDLSEVVPLMCRIYPNGLADVNHFQVAGGMSFLIRELLKAGLLHNDVLTIKGDKGLSVWCEEPKLVDGKILWQMGIETSLDEAVLRGVNSAFSKQGGIKLMSGNIGRAVIKTSALKDEAQIIKAPAIIFDNQDVLQTKFKNGELDKDFIAVIRFQEPKANGMPELHKLMTVLGVLQDRGYKVALITDGRMSGASGKVPAAIHCVSEALDEGPLAKVQEGDLIEFDIKNGKLSVVLDEVVFKNRKPVRRESKFNEGMGRDLFATLRATVNAADQGATIFHQK